MGGSVGSTNLLHMKVCSSCGEDFEPSSRHRACPKCRMKSRPREKCKCGRSMKHGSPQCKFCNSTAINNGNWRGGRYKACSGYVLVHAPGHPRVSAGGRYVLEHIIVMERELGRVLYPGETVHHKNGVRDDNRPENLELWVRSQPSGIRVADAVEWAREVLRRYESGKMETQ